MISENPLVSLFQTYASLDNPPVIELLNIDKKPVGAIYFDKLNYDKLLQRRFRILPLLR